MKNGVNPIKVLAGMILIALLFFFGIDYKIRNYTDAEIAELLFEHSPFGHETLDSMLEAELFVKSRYRSTSVDLTVLVGPLGKGHGERESIDLYFNWFGGVKKIEHFTIEHVTVEEAHN